MTLKANSEGLAVTSEKMRCLKWINGEACYQRPLYLNTLIAETRLGIRTGNGQWSMINHLLPRQVSSQLNQ
ncbi:MAG: hypothetical protein ABIN67_07745 [Ferruginibacter sp.]